MTAARTIDLSGGDVRAWSDDSTVCIKAATKQGDHVVLAVSEVRRLAEALIGMADAIDAGPAEDP
jgi:hypothetical protein